MSRREQKTGRTALCGMLIALAFLFSYVETLIPISLGIPGVKLGLANLVTIVGLYLVSLPQLILISLVRIVLAGLTFGNGFSMIYSLAGGALSFFSCCWPEKRDGSARRESAWPEAWGTTWDSSSSPPLWWKMERFFITFFLLAAGSAAGAVIGMLGGIVTKRIGPAVRRLS